MEPSGPFAVLGLDPATCDAAAVRAAYARLVKQHRPDRDPAGFRRVRDAYEFCTSPLGAALMAAARGGGPVTMADAPTTAVAPAAPDGTVAVGTVEPRAPVAAPESAPPPTDDPDALFTAWDRDDPQPLLAAARRWHGTGDWPRLRDLGRRWLARLAPHAGPDDGDVALLLADVLALYDAALAGGLLDAGFPLAGRARRALPRDLELRLHVGGVIAGMDDALRGELLAALAAAGDAGHLPAADLARRLRAAFAPLPHDQATVTFIDRRLRLWTGSAERRHRSRAAPMAPSPRQVRARRIPAAGSLRDRALLIVVGFVVTVFFLVFINPDTRLDWHLPHLPPPTPVPLADTPADATPAVP